MAEKKKKEFTLRKLVFNDKYLIISSIILAVIIWIATSMNLSPLTTKTLTVPLNVDLKGSAADQLGLKCYGDSALDIEVTVSCKKYLARDLKEDNINVSLQTNAITTNGFLDVPINVTTDSTDYQIESYYPTTYHAFFDVEDSKVMDVSVNYPQDNYVEEGYVMGEPLLSESTVTLTGPQTYIANVYDVVADVRFSELLTETKTVDLDLKPIDAYGNKVDYISINEGGDAVSVTIPVLKHTKLDVTTSLANKPTGLTSDFQVTYDVTQVNAGVLEDANIKSANIGTIDYSQLTVGENTFTFNVQELESIVVLDNIKTITATVTVPDTYTTKTLSVNTGNVVVTNAPDGYKYSVEGLSSYEVTVVGMEGSIEQVEAGNISIVVDLASVDDDEASLGVNSYKALLSIDGSNTCWVYGEYLVNVNLYE